ncbi:hypothetical protein D3C76_706980 [compost metagenome]
MYLPTAVSSDMPTRMYSTQQFQPERKPAKPPQYLCAKWLKEPATGSSTIISPSWRMIRKAMKPAMA